MMSKLDLSDIYSFEEKVLEKRRLCEEIIEYLLTYRYTLRSISEEIGVSTTTIHYTIHHFIKFYFEDEYSEIKSLLKYNKENKFKPRRQWR